MLPMLPTTNSRPEGNKQAPNIISLLFHRMKFISFVLCLASAAGKRLRGHRKLKLCDNSHAIDDQYIIRFDSSKIRNAKSKAQVLAEQIGGIQVLFTYNSVFKGASLTGVSSIALRQILDDEDVLFVEQDQIVEMGGEEEEEEEYAPTIFSREDASYVDLTAGIQGNPQSWGLDRIDQEGLPLNKEFHFGSFTGKDVIVYVLDSGVRLSHDEFGGRAECSKNLVPEESCDDVRGHGTFVAATIGGAMYGVAKGVKIKAVKVIASSGSTSYSVLISGFNHVIFERVLRFWDRTPMVINTSVGGQTNEMLNSAATKASNLGIVVVSSAGNEWGDACDYSPGSASEVITVSATNNYDSRSIFSNYGSCVDIFAPGDWIKSAGVGSDDASSRRSGTSMAAPHVAGAVALYIQRYPDLTARQIRDKLLEDASEGVVKQPGAYSSNRFLQIPV